MVLANVPLNTVIINNYHHHQLTNSSGLQSNAVTGDGVLMKPNGEQ